MTEKSPKLSDTIPMTMKTLSLIWNGPPSRLSSYKPQDAKI
jgi:hypothetical protein